MFVDPDNTNIAAIRAYEKVGFKKVSEQLDTGEVWMLKNFKNQLVLAHLAHIK